MAIRTAALVGLLASLWIAGLVLADPAPAAAPLPRGAVRSYGEVALRHPAVIQMIALSGDGKRALTFAADAQIRCWEVETGKLLGQHAAKNRGVGMLAISADGQFAAVQDHSQTVSIFKADGLTPLHTINQAMWPQATTSGNLMEIVKVGGGLRGELISMETGKTVRRFDRVQTMPMNVAVREDGSAVVLDTQGIVTWLAQDGSTLGTPKPLDESDRIHRQRLLSANGRRAVALRDDQKHIAIYAIGAGPDEAIKPAVRWTEYKQGMQIRSLSPDGRYAILMAPTGSLIVLDLENATDITAKTGITGAQSHLGTNVGFSGDSWRLAVGAGTHCLRVLDTRDWRSAYPTQGHVAPIRCMAAPVDGQRLVTAAGDGTIRIWDRGTGRQVRAIEDAGTSAAPFAVSQDGRVLLTARRDGRVIVEDLAGDGEAILAPASTGGKGGPISCALSPDGRYAGALGDGQLRVFDVGSRKPVGRYDLQGASARQAGRLWLGAGGRSAATWFNGQFAVFSLVSEPANVGSLVPLVRINAAGNPELTQIAPGPTWDTVLCASGADATHLEVFSAIELSRLKCQAEAVKRPELFTGQPRGQGMVVAMAEGAALAATVGDDRRIRFWDLQTGQCVHTSEPAPTTLAAAAFSADGKSLFVGGLDGSVLEWSVPAEAQAVGVRAIAAGAQEIEGAIETMATARTAEAYARIKMLAGAGEAAVGALERAAAAPRFDQEEFQRLLSGLDAASYRERQRSEKALVALGPVVVSPLQIAKAGGVSMEVHNRIPQILSRIRAGERSSPVLLQRFRAVHALEAMGTCRALEAVRSARSPQQPPLVLQRIQLAIDRMSAGGGKSTDE